MMPYRRYAQLNRVEKRLAKRLLRLIRYLQTARHKEAARRYCEAQAYGILQETFNQITDWTRRMNVRRDLHKRSPKPLSYADEQQLKLELLRKFDVFKQILNDAA
jgi:hypothetical protein